MSLISKVLKRFNRPSTKKLVVAGAFTLALATSVTLGLVTRGYLSAAVIRDDAVNSIDNCNSGGGVGAADAKELIGDLKDPKCSKDIAAVYADSRVGGLTADKYTQFANQAVDGYTDRSGNVFVNGQVVMKDVVSMGRTTLGGRQTSQIKIGDKTYYFSDNNHSFASTTKTIPVMVLFDENGVAQVVIMDPCGNPVWGTKITNSVTCDKINHTQDANNPNQWSFTTDATFGGNAKLSKVVYHFSDGTPDVTKTSLTDVVNHEFKKDGDVTVTVFASVPGSHEIKSVAIEKCKFHVTHVSPKAVCTALVPLALDDSKQKFSFTVKVKTDKGVTVKNVDFTVDGASTTTETTKDANGNIFKNYSFTDTKTHTVEALVRFTTVEGEKTDKCKASVTGTKTPVCTVPGHEGEAPNSPTCGFCLPGVPIGDAKCTPPKLVDTGPGNVIGLFGATSAIGAVGHHFVAKRRASRK